MLVHAKLRKGRSPSVVGVRELLLWNMARLGYLAGQRTQFFSLAPLSRM
jgi:DNA-binding transcriptional regulator GbsR (MarR family)